MAQYTIQLNINTLSSSSSSSLVKNLPKYNQREAIFNIDRRWRLRCVANKQTNISINKPSSGYYKPSSWTHEFIMTSLGDDRGMEVPKERSIEKLEETVKHMLDDEEKEPMEMLELIVGIQRLGLGYRFRESTKRALDRIIRSEEMMKKIHSVHYCALSFILLRQHGFKVSIDIFENFKDENGNFQASLASDVQGMLSLYEASHFAHDGEIILDEAREFSTRHLKEMVEKIETKIGLRVSHALETPFHQRMQRLEARWNIEAYSKEDKARQDLHTLAILDFNMVQSGFQRDLQQVSCWWKDVGLANKLHFARDRLMESFFWSVGMVWDPQFSECRKGLTKVAKLITIIDDVYDVYGSPEELVQFTDAVQRWDINYALQHLPHYMKICFLALYNTVNNMAYDVLKEQGQVILPHLTKVWGDLCKLFLKEAQWRHNGHIPTFDEYLRFGWMSSSGPLLLVHAYFLMTQNITSEAIESLNNYPPLLRYPSTIFRLCNDLSSSKAEIESGETTNAISCYKHEHGVTEEVARKHIRSMIDVNWKMMNEELISNSLFEESFVEVAMNLARIAQCHYSHGNAHSDPSDVTRNRVLSVIVEPIQVKQPPTRISTI